METFLDRDFVLHLSEREVRIIQNAISSFYFRNSSHLSQLLVDDVYRILGKIDNSLFEVKSPDLIEINNFLSK